MARLATLVCAFMFLAPATARAKFQLRFEGNPTLDENGRMTVGVFAEPTDHEDEQLAAYDIGFFLERITPSQAQRALSFAPPYATRPAEGFVFGDDPVVFDAPSSVFPAPGPGWFALTVEAGTGTPLRDITSAVKLATLHIARGPEPLLLGDAYRLRFDEETTVFASGDPRRPDSIIEYTISTAPDSGWIGVIPEPSAAGLMLAGAALTLCRRRRR